jgi:CubicO group peptidase (beta-lactamase class C family)
MRSQRRERMRMKAVLSAVSCSASEARRAFVYTLLALVVMGASTAIAQSGGALTQRLDSIAGAGVRENRAVGIVAAVVKGKDTVLLEAYGKADVQADVPMTVDTIISIGSVTKQFTAAAILQLRDAGKLSLDDDIIVHTGTYAAGAICSTAQDMITWLQALHGGKVLSPKSYAEMITPSTLNDGTRLRYASGLFVGEDRRGLRTIGHDGGGFGFSAVANWYPDAQLAVVVLTNSEPDTIAVVTEDLATAVLPVPRPASRFPGDASLLVGKYRGPGRGTDMVIDVTQTPQGIEFAFDGTAAAPLPWVEVWTFRRNSGLLTFRQSGNSGPATELRFDTGGGHFILKRQ